MVLGPIMDNIQNLVKNLTPDKIRSLSEQQKIKDIKTLKETRRDPAIRDDRHLDREIKDDVGELKSSLALNSTDHFNKMIEEARERNACDVDCQFRKRSAELKIKCDKAKKYESVDEERALNECKKYYIYTHGESAWQDHRDKELNERVSRLIHQFKRQIDIEKNNSEL